jgi:SAM-dependent methyltransferase
MICRFCHSQNHSLLWVDRDNGNWYRCDHCGSHNSTHPYRAEQYETLDLTPVGRRESFQAPADWFGHYAHLAPTRDFLDVGFGDDIMMSVMQEKGWSVHGFDVHESRKLGPHTTIHPHFTSALFSNHFDAVFCSHVIEHVEHPTQFLVELRAVCRDGGLIQLRCPRPQVFNHDAIYAKGHLCIPSLIGLELEFLRLGLEILDQRADDNQQEWLLRRHGKL